MPTYLTGNDGGVSLGTNHGANFNVWNATFSRNVSDISGFADSARRRKLGVHDVSGSAGGYLVADSKGPGVNTTNWKTDGVTIYLHARGSGSATAATNCTLSFGAIISDVALSNVKTGDSAVSFNFALSSGSAPTETWDESA